MTTESRRLPRCVLLVAFANAFVHASPAEDNGAAKYRRAFYTNALATLERMNASSPDAAKTAQTLTDCHMRVMQVYSPALQETAFTVVRDGGSYQQAKAAFSAAIATESAAGGERNAAVKQMFERAMQVGQECLKQLPQEEQ